MKLTGYHERTIDDKNRLLIPAEFRSVLVPRPEESRVLYVVLGERPHTLSLVSEDQFNAWSDGSQTEFMSEEEALDFEQRFYSTAARLEIDKQGRVVIPDHLIAKARLKGEVVVCGAKFRVDVWRKAEYEAFMGIDWENDWPKWQKFLRQPRPVSTGGASSS